MVMVRVGVELEPGRYVTRGKCPRTVKIGPTILWQTALVILMTFNIFGLIKSLKEDQPLGLNTNS